jgi:enoyl-CoA hydratase/carnithine racemase
MTYEFLAIETKDRISTIRLNREEKRNALSMKVRDEIESCLRKTDLDSDVAVAVLTGGKNVFSAGFDLQEVIATRFQTFGYRVHEFSEALYGFSKPLITAVSGPAMAGGFDLALAGDFIIASETATFGHPEVNFGSAPGLTILWPRVGLAKAKELAMVGSTTTADEAYRIGLVNRVVPVDGLMDEALALARTLAGKPPAALRAVKEAARRIATLELFAAMKFEGELGLKALQDPENVRRVEAYFASLKGKK